MARPGQLLSFLDRLGGSPAIARFVLVVLPLATLALTLVTWRWARLEEQAFIEQMTSVETSRISAEIADRVREAADTVERVTDRWRLRDPQGDSAWEYDITAQRLAQPSLDVMEWLEPDGTVRFAAPSVLVDGTDPSVSPELEQAREAAATTFAGPVPTTSGAPGLRLVAPVYRGASFDGWIVAVHDLRAMLRTALDQVGTGFSLMVLNASGEEIFGRYPEEAPLMERWGQEVLIDIGFLDLRLRVWPTAGTLEQTRSSLPQVALVAGLLLTVLLVTAIRLAQVSGLRAKEAEMNASLQEQIVARRRAERSLERRARELARSNREFERFAYAASHDLKDPLNAIGMNVQAVLARADEEDLPEGARRQLEAATRAVFRTGDMLEGLLEYARAGHAQDEMDVVSASAAVDDAVENLEMAITDAGASIRREDLPDVVARRSQLTRLFQNLIANAIKFRGERRPNVHISARDGEEGWVFAVRDNGKGMGPVEAEQAFELFWRPDGDSEGAGVGLAVCKRIVEGHGGRIWVASEPDVGSTFHFVIPREPRDL